MVLERRVKPLMMLSQARCPGYIMYFN